MDKDKEEGRTLILGPEYSPCRYLVPVKDPPGPGNLSNGPELVKDSDQQRCWIHTGGGGQTWSAENLERLVWVRQGGVGAWPQGRAVQKHRVRLGLEGTQTVGLTQMVHPDQE